MNVSLRWLWMAAALLSLSAGCAHAPRTEATPGDPAAQHAAEKRTANWEKSAELLNDRVMGQLGATPAVNCAEICEWVETICSLADSICEIADSQVTTPTIRNRCVRSRTRCEDARNKSKSTCTCEK